MADENKNDDKDQNFAKLREKIDRLEQREAKLRGVAVQGIVAQAGLDPKDPVVTLVREKWENSIEDLDDLTPDAFGEFAGQYNLVPGDSGEGDGKDDTDDGDDDDDFSAALEAAQARSDKAKGASKEPKSKDADKRIAEAEQKGDFNASFHEKISSLGTL